jgi:AraC family transcriptional regulator
MSDLDVEIVFLEPMRVASIRAFGKSPERQAWQKLCAWAEPKGYLDRLAEHPVFGFNNPGPSPDSSEYGYEFWISVSGDEKSGGGIEIKEFPGGFYAVTSCRLFGDPNIMQTWQLLWDWLQASELQWRETHELERPRDPMADEQALEFELYLPIEKPSGQPRPGYSDRYAL